MADRIPEEVLADILTRLTIEDLVRCIAVCKSWYSLITSPNFVSFHMNQPPISTNPRLLLVKDFKIIKPYVDRKPSHLEHYSIRFERNPFQVYKDLDLPIKSHNNADFRIVGCFNGVICLSDDSRRHKNSILLWNPSIRKSVTLPKPLITYSSHRNYMLAVGFAFDAVTNDFKVIRAAHRPSTEKEDSFRAEVYSLSFGSWRMAGPKKFPYVIDDRSSQALLNGAVHWVGRTVKRQSNNRFQRVIVLMDVADEVFSTVALPSCVEDSLSTLGIQLSAFGESLYISQFFGPGNEDKSSIWVMKQYGLPDSWTKLFTVDHSIGFLTPFGLRNNGDAPSSLMMLSSETMLLSYEVESGQLRCRGVYYGYKRVAVEYFQETLALLGVKGGALSKPSPRKNFLQRMLKIHLKEKIQVSRKKCRRKSRGLQPANPPRPNSMPLGQAVVSCFGRS